jgi:epoxide hydrolase-like predicted phosphatase
LGLKALIFDFGGVLVRTSDRSLRARWEGRLALADGQAEYIVFGGETGWDVQLGTISDAAHWRRLGARLGLDDVTLARFRDDFFAGDELDLDLVAYLGRLRARYHVGLLSNAGDNAHLAFAEKWAILDCFDSVTISAEEGLMKPDARIFRLALARAGVEPAEALLVDDARANVEGARQIGMQALHFTDSAAARRQLVLLTGVD